MRRIVSFLACLGLLAACESSGQDHDGHAHTPDTAMAACEAGQEGIDSFAIGLERATDTGTYMLKFMEATPAPPDKGDNTFTVQVLDAGGAPVDGLTLTLEPLMPQHGHGTVPATFAGTAQADGTYLLGPANLFMAGNWQVDIHVDGPGGKHTATFNFCIEG